MRVVSGLSEGVRRDTDRRRRVLDLLLTVPGTLLASPLLIGTAALVRVKMGSPVLFRQERAGRDGVPFTLVKFRTMAVRATHEFDPSDDASRIIPMGALLRSLSLDELPQLWNVLRGDMSLVGPRPLPTEYVDRYTRAQRRRLEVRPGMTGLAQVSGRNGLSWEERFALDVEYVETRTVMGDLRILRRTFVSVLRREGISAAGTTTMTEFQGGSVVQ